MSLRNNIRRMGVVLVLAFAAPMAALVYWQVIRASALRANPANRHAAARRKRIVRGEVLSAGGTRLAFNQLLPSGDSRRLYPLGPAAAHVIGYDSRRHGRADIEKSQDSALMALGRYADPWGASWRRGKAIGCDVRLTINAETQQVAYSELAWRRGAVVVLEPRTGAILAMASSPSFDANELDERWDDVVNAAGSPLLNRATVGLYEAGDVFRLVAAAAALDSGAARPNDTFRCLGEAVVGGCRVQCTRRGGHGRVSLERAFKQNCRVAFARLAEKLGPDLLRDYFAALHLDAQYAIGVPTAAGRVYERTNRDGGGGERSDGSPIAATVTPLGMACVAACLANDGVLMEPRLVGEIIDARGRVKFRATPTVAGRALKKPTADLLNVWMSAFEWRGLPRSEEIPRGVVAGVMGIAPGPGGRRDSWFVGFGPVDRPTAAVAVVIEDVGPRGEQAASAARSVLSQLLGARGAV